MAAPQELLEKIKRFPTRPGVYIMRDERKRTIYVGKAINLRSRVRSYFSKSSDTRVFHRFLVERVREIDCIVTESETEALLLENNLIKKRRPVFNIRLRDDKTYVRLKLTLNEEWPRVLVTRRFQDDGSVYFGPFGSARSVREMLRVIKRVFPLRTCSNGFFKTRKRPCIEYDIGRCTAPCVGFISAEDYRGDVDEVLLFLRGQTDKLLEILGAKMARASASLEYELAARYRDQIRSIERVFEVQKVQTVTQGDVDVFAHYRSGESIALHELVVRDGRVVNSSGHSFRTTLEAKEVLQSFLAQYYLEERQIPRQILCDLEFPERKLLQEWLRERRGAAVDILIPVRGDKRRLVEMALENAKNFFDVESPRSERLERTLESLGKTLGAKRKLHRIECYDISNFQGNQAVGSLVVFEGGVPERGQYRKFRIKTVEGADDFESMREVLDRRFTRWKHNLPDLVVIDGGKGQLGVAEEVLRRHGLDDIALISLAKMRRRRGTTERIFSPGESEPLAIAQDSPESLLIQHLRDEAHRFALRYHRQLRSKASLRSGLEGIAGVGPSRRQKLLDHFGSLKKIKTASIAELTEVLGPRLAETVYEHLRQKKSTRSDRKRSPGPEDRAS